MRKRRILLVLALLLLVGVVSALWSVFDWPPPRLIIQYGLPPTGGPTGQTRTVQGIEFVEISPGYLRMGSHFWCERGDFLGRVGEFVGVSIGDPPRHADMACPPRWVEIEKPFWIARTEVTNGQYQRWATDWDDFDYPDRPVVCITTKQVGRFCQWLGTDRTETFRLPTPEEWEYACSAGTQSGDAASGDLERIQQFAWCRQNVKDGMEQTVGTLLPNRFGIYDMHGNVAEWCSDCTYRGGNWLFSGDECRSDWAPALVNEDAYLNVIGFRPVFTLP